MGKRSSFPRIARDFYPTPEDAVVPLIRHLSFGTMFVEPCAGDGALVRHLEAAGMSCLAAFDIAPQADWIRERDAAQDDCRTFDGSEDCFITNPPWARPVLHGIIANLSCVKPTWLLFDADWVHTRQAVPFLPWLRKIVSVGRVRWIADSRMTGKDNCAWHLFDQRTAGAVEFVGRMA